MAGERIVIFGWAHRVHTQRWVAGMQGRGFDIKVISLGGEKPLPGVETVFFPHTGKAAYIRWLSRAAQEAKKFKPALVHAHYAAGFGLWAIKTGIKPFLVSVWGSDVTAFPSNFISRALIRRILKKADSITATSGFLKQVCIELLPQSEQKITIIPFGVEIPPDIAPLPDKPLKLCYIKGHHSKYGPEILLKAMVEIKKKIPEVMLSMAGEGNLTRTLKSQTRELGLTDNVRFVGFIDNKEIYNFLKQHHLMIMPSLTESFGVAVLEAGACGRPSIASHIGGTPEVIVDGQTGFLVTSGDINQLAKTVIRVADDVDNINKMGHSAYQFVKDNYSWEKSLDMMASVYERLIYDKKKNSPL